VLLEVRVTNKNHALNTLKMGYLSRSYVMRS
jgi:hypothetical protein